MLKQKMFFECFVNNDNWEEGKFHYTISVYTFCEDDF